jgi:DNA helicase-2/ATP-dependent DNA helicase PcrA
MLAYLNVINNPYDYTRLSRIINEPKRGIGDTTLEKVALIANKQGMRFFDVLKRSAEFPELSKSAEKLSSFAAFVERYAELAKDTPLPELFEMLYRDIGYENMLRNTCSFEDYQSKHQNVMELMSNIRQFVVDAENPTLAGYLEQTALVSATDTLSDENDVVVLMTMHCAKGLEYDTVFITGFEEGLFPSAQSLGSTEDVEEERRLCYVAITRAKKKLYIISTRSRLLYGSVRPGIPSRFLEEIPSENIEMRNAPRAEAPSYQKAQKKPPVRHIISDRITVVPEKHSSSVKYHVGQRVRHRIFGEGVITEAVNMSSDSLLEIDFPSAGKKKLMANFAKLEIID